MEANTTQQAKAKLDEAIQRNVQGAANTMRRVMEQIPEDSIVKADALEFYAPHASTVMMKTSDKLWGLHDNGLRQVAQIAKVPADYVDILIKGDEGHEWRNKLLADILTRTFSHSSKRHLVRSIGGEARGFLSDKYRRLDARPIFDAFAQACREAGAVPYGGRGSDTRVSLRMIVPSVHVLDFGGIEVAGHKGPKNDYLAFGLEISTSDFGNGSLAIRAFILRLTCVNGATAEDVMRQAHLGGRLEDDIEYSQKTLELDTRTTISAVKDKVKGLLNEAKYNAMTSRILKAQSTETSWDNLKARLTKTLTKEELRKADEAFNGPDVLNLPPGNTLWRASNAISWILQSAESQDRQMQLEKLAGSLIENKVVDVAA